MIRELYRMSTFRWALMLVALLLPLSLGACFSVPASPLSDAHRPQPSAPDDVRVSGGDDKPDFRNVPGDVVLDLASDTDMRWLQFQVTGVRWAAPTQMEKFQGDRMCAAKYGPGARLIGLLRNPDGTKQALCYPAVSDMLEREEGHRQACAMGFARRFLKREARKSFARTSRRRHSATRR